MAGGLSAARREPISERVGRPQVTHVVAAHQRLRARDEQVIERAVDADRLLGGRRRHLPFQHHIGMTASTHASVTTPARAVRPPTRLLGPVSSSGDLVAPIMTVVPIMTTAPLLPLPTPLRHFSAGGSLVILRCVNANNAALAGNDDRQLAGARKLARRVPLRTGAGDSRRAKLDTHARD